MIGFPVLSITLVPLRIDDLDAFSDLGAIPMMVPEVLGGAAEEVSAVYILRRHTGEHQILIILPLAGDAPFVLQAII